MRKLVLVACLLVVSVLPVSGQTLNDSDIVSQSPMFFRFVPGFDPSGRLFYDFFNDTMIAFPGTQRARTVRAFFNIPIMQHRYVYEFEMTGFRPPTMFGLIAQKCVEQALLDETCSVIHWRETDATPGAYRLSPAPSTEQPNPPSFPGNPGDRFAIEWDDAGPNAWGSFNYYRNRELVFSTFQTAPVTPFSDIGWTIAATFDASESVQSFVRAQEIQFIP